jgi:hypothetical protein
VPRELRDVAADGGVRRVLDHPVARLERDDVLEHRQRRRRIGLEHRRLREVDARRQRHDRRGLGDDDVAPAARRHRHDDVADCGRGDAGADRLDTCDALRAGYRRQLRQRAVAPLDHQQVGGIDVRHENAQPHLAGTGRGRIGALEAARDLGRRAEAIDHDRLHATRLFFSARRSCARGSAQGIGAGRKDQALLDLLRAGARQRVDEDDPARQLVIGELVLRRGEDRLGGVEARTPAIRQHHAGHHLLVAQRVGHGEHRDLLHLGVIDERVLDLGGGDVLAGASDDVLPALDEMEHAVGLLGDDVAGVEPPAAPGLRRRRLVLEIAAEEAEARIVAGPAHDELAGRAARDLDVGSRRRPWRGTPRSACRRRAW